MDTNSLIIEHDFRNNKEEAYDTCEPTAVFRYPSDPKCWTATSPFNVLALD